MNGPLYNVYFTEIVQYEDDATQAAVLEAFDIHEPDSRSEAFKYTLNLDLDGNGRSERFYRLLNSQSLKQTALREWHGERLQPWLHYVPVSLGMEELPEAARYLADEEDGRQAAAMMAEMGWQWSLRVLRLVDQAISLYRLMLELGRLQHPERPAS